MAFPVVEGRSGSTEITNVTTHDVSYPATVSPGALLIAATVYDEIAAAPITWPGGWTSMWEDIVAGGIAFSIRRATAVGTEDGGAFQITTEDAVRSVHRVWSITGQHSSTAPAIVGQDLGAVADPNPPNLDPSAWGTEDTLWLAIAGRIASDSVSNFPSNYGNTFNQSAGTNVELMAAERSLNASSEDPGIFNMSGATARQSMAYTVAIRPAALSRRPSGLYVKQAVERASRW